MVMKNTTNITRPVQNGGRTRLRPVARAPKRSPAPKLPVFGPVATIDTAPVAIGNTVSGSEPVVTPVQNGIRIRGRDFLINLDAVQAGLSGWYMVGGAPLIPHALTSSLLKSYAGIYSQFVIHGLAFHFITAVGTGTQGDIALMVNKSIGDPIVDSSSANFLSVLLSDKNTVFGPLWKNHTAVFHPPPIVYSTDILNDEDLTHRGPGELIVFTKSSVEQIPGYVLMDYDITFKTMQVNIRALTFPITKMKYYQSAFFLASQAVTTASRAFFNWGGFTLDGQTAVPPPGLAVGDIYKAVFVPGISTLTNCTLSNLLAVTFSNGTGATVLDNFTITYGTTVYVVAYTTDAFVVYPTYDAAKSQNRSMNFNVAATIGVLIPAYFSFVGSVGDQKYSQSHI
jgi:hypothetical protein